MQTRRAFLRRCAVAGAAWTARSWAAVPGANSNVRIAVVGLGCGPLNRGEVHLKAYLRIPGVTVAAICDVDTAVLDRVGRKLKAAGKRIPPVVDARELLARSDIDAISIATPNHWHSLLSIWACQAGKDVYVEKPVSHNLWEGRQLVRAAQKYGRVVQAGTQSRSDRGLQEAVAWIRGGGLGRLHDARGLCYRRRPSIGLVGVTPPVPATVDFNLWCGPAPLVPPHRRQFHYDWHWFWATGNGDVANDGAHRMDVARWFLGEPKLAPHAMSVGGRLGYRDDGQTPNTLATVLGYPSAPLIFEVRGLPASSGTEKMDQYEGESIGVIVRGEGGTLVAGRTIHARDETGRTIQTFSSRGSNALQDHFVNFIDVVRSRRVQDLRGPIEDGYVSTSLCHLANISYRLGHQSLPGEIRERIRGNGRLAEAFGRMNEHLGRNGVDLAKTEATLGLPIELDPVEERFPDNPDAERLRRPAYRAPFVVPEAV